MSRGTFPTPRPAPLGGPAIALLSSIRGKNTISGNHGQAGIGRATAPERFLIFRPATALACQFLLASRIVIPIRPCEITKAVEPMTSVVMLDVTYRLSLR